MAIMEGRSSNTVTLTITIKKILESPLSNNEKQQMIDSKFKNLTCFKLEDCCDLMPLSFNLVLINDAKRPESTGWCILRNLEQTHQSILAETIDCSHIEMLVTLASDTARNVHEVPSLMKWCLKNGINPELQTAVRSSIVRFLQTTECPSVVKLALLLGETAGLLGTHPDCIPSSPLELSELSGAIIEKLAELVMPQESEFLILVMNNVQAVEGLLRLLADHSGDRRKHLATYLKLLYAVVSDSERFPAPSPTLATVLQVVDLELVPGSVQSILADHPDCDSLVRLSAMLCTWLIRSPRATNLSAWVLSLMTRLEEEQRADVLTAVAEQMVSPLMKAMPLPFIRPGVQPVLLRMLPGHCGSALPFHKAVPDLGVLIAQLRRERTPTSRATLQQVLNMSAHCMQVFPGFPKLYAPLLRAHETCWQEERLAASAGSTQGNPQWQAVPATPTRVGLQNLGNTCYMNSVLQALYMTHRFCMAVLQSDAPENIQPVLCTLQRLFALLLHSRRPTISADGLLSLTRPPGFSPGHQQDSSEFLIHLLDILHEQEKNQRVRLLPEAGDGDADPGPSSRNPGMSMSAGGEAAAAQAAMLAAQQQQQQQREETEEGAEGEAALGAVGPAPTSHSHPSSPAPAPASSPGPGPANERESIVRRIFGGELRIRYRCLHCGFESSHTDPFIELQVCFPEEAPPTPPSSAGSAASSAGASADSPALELQGLVHALVSPEQLSGDNSYRCDRCRSLQEGVRLLQVVQAPQYLILILKHFRYNPSTKQRMKLMHRVHYTETLELPVASSGPGTAYQSSARYSLYAAIVHSGRSVDAGHYYTYARDASGGWTRMDDETVAGGGEEELRRLRPPDTPYMLFYCGTEGTLQPAPGASDSPAITELQPQLMRLVMADNAAFLQEERQRSRRPTPGPSPRPPGERRPRPDEDEDGPPGAGGSCGGQVDTSTPPNRFVF